MDVSNITPTNFIEEFINEDIENGVYSKVQTRFPPEPNGYLHIGHAKAICIDFGTAEKYGGVCNLRLDDTNPTKEDTEYVDAIIEDIKWLGFKIENVYYASDYFDKILECAFELIKQGKAYVCDLTPEEINAYRGTFTEPGKNSPYRDRSVEENLDLFNRMIAGEFPTGSKVLRAKIDMASPNMNMRDPIIYRVLHAEHHRTGNKWCVYPMYDFAHPISDAAEGVTFSLCTLEFEDHRPLYDWPLNELNWPEAPRQIEFARMNLSYTITSKRRCLRLVKDGLVSGWDDPRMATLCGMRRRGYPAAAIREFVNMIGVSKANSVIDYSMLESCVRDNLNKNAERAMAVLRPVKVIVDNFPNDVEETIEVPINPEKPELGNKTVIFTKELYIEQDDFCLEPPNRKYFRLCPEKEVRLKGAYFVKYSSCEFDDDGNISVIHVTYDPESKGGESPDGRKVKGTLHWVSAKHCKDAQVRLYDRLFNVENPSDETGVKDFTEHLNPNSMIILNNCKVTDDVVNANAGDTFQFMRQGYFCIDKDTNDNKIVINRVVALKDSWASKQ